MVVTRQRGGDGATILPVGIASYLPDIIAGSIAAENPSTPARSAPWAISFSPAAKRFQFCT